MTDTPRTDEKVKIVRLTVGCVELPENHMVSADFARQLERELAEAQAEIERQTDRIMSDACIISAAALAIAERDKLIEQMRVALKLALLFIPENAVDAIRLSKAALSAAERGDRI